MAPPSPSHLTLRWLERRGREGEEKGRRRGGEGEEKGRRRGEKGRRRGGEGEEMGRRRGGASPHDYQRQH